MTLCLLPYTLSLFVAQQGWLSCYYLKMNYNIIISTCSYCIVCIIHKDLLFILFFLIYNRIGLSPICVIRTYVCPNMDNWTAATIVREVSAEQRLGRDWGWGRFDFTAHYILLIRFALFNIRRMHRLPLRSAMAIVSLFVVFLVLFLISPSAICGLEKRPFYESLSQVLKSSVGCFRLNKLKQSSENNRSTQANLGRRSRSGTARNETELRATRQYLQKLTKGGRSLN